jgi:hypothetical protein
MYDVDKDGVSYSHLEQYLQCPRAFSLYRQGYCRKSDVKLELGNYGHKALEVIRKKAAPWRFDPKVGKWEQAIISTILRLLIPAYLQYWKKEEKEVSHNPEVWFDVIKNGLHLKGKIDDFIGHHTVLDTKFKGRVDDDNIQLLLPLNLQGKVYCYANNVKAFILDAVRFPQIKEFAKPEDIYIKLAADLKNHPDKIFSRNKVTFTNQVMTEFEGWLRRIIDRIRNDKHFDPNYNSCWRCDFVKYCAQGDKSCLHKKH